VANITRADLVKKRGEPPVLFHYPMEREEAARTGLLCRNINEYKPQEILQQVGGSLTRAAAVRLTRIFQDLKVQGKVSVAGTMDLAAAYPLLEEVRKLASDIDLVTDGDDPVLIKARSTKSDEEIQKIRSIGRIAASVMADTAEFLSSHSERSGSLVQRNGDPLFIQDVKTFIRRRITELGAEIPEGVIFAQGRDAGIPHSTGTDGDPVLLGKPIVFDLFPCEAGGGYFYDITRTWCLGYAPDEVEQLHRQVLQAHDEAIVLARRGEPCREIQRHVCRRFAEGGHSTLMENPSSECGYVHNLGHGVGLAVHESPSFADAESNRDLLETGAVFTVEPGLYYPDQGIGVRIEDTLWIKPDGSAEVLAPFATDLVLKVRGKKPGKPKQPERKTPAKNAKRKKKKRYTI
jgi:Xaa-Pro aminopeptidase